MKKTLLIILFLVTSLSAQNVSLINTSHLDHLYDEVNVQGRKVGIVHIYSEYPDYQLVGDDDEGIACVDDAARAAIFYLRYYKINGDKELLRKAKQLIQFLLVMQSDSGFTNFIKDDFSRNTSGKTSVASSNWWTWRAMWAMSEAYSLLSVKTDSSYDRRLADRTRRSLIRALPLLKKIFAGYPATSTKESVIMPQWLPHKSASDQAAVLIMALVPLYEKAKDNTLYDYIKKLAEGIMLMQMGDKDNAPYYAHLSWENSWHAWGSNQAEALLKAGRSLNDKKMIQSALNEIDSFYDYLIENKYLSSFILENRKIEKSEQYPQIAYGFSPLISACMLAAEITGDKKYAEKGARIALWFAGDNPAQAQMYDLSSGRVYDGINGRTDLNRNSGAESTIEALLAMLEIEKNPVARDIVLERYKNNQGN